MEGLSQTWPRAVAVRLALLALVAALAALALPGCGGGGSSASSSPSEPSATPTPTPTPTPEPTPTPPPATPPPDLRVPFGTQGPWPVENRTYGSAQGLLESRVVAITTDEAQNRWIATPDALYVFTPGATAPRRFTAADGLHLAGNPESYCETVTGYSFGRWSSSAALGWDGATCADPANFPCYPSSYPACTVTGAATSAGISTLAGGRPNEVFVGYHGENTGGAGSVGPNGIEGDKDDPGRHSGKIDWVRLNADGTLTVVRFDLVSVAHGMIYWHNRTVERLLYDHFTHPGSLYAGTNHGVDYLRVDKWRPHAKAAAGSGFDEWVDSWLQEWMGDHLHAEAHALCPDGQPCTGERGLLLGDWKGLALDAAGDLWHAGKWAAGRIAWDPSPLDWIQPAPGVRRMTAHFTSDHGTSVFPPPANLKDGINLSAVAVAPDGRVWFASDFGGHGLASWKQGEPGFSRHAPTGLGLPSNDVVDLVALPDGRLAVAHDSGGVVLWDPATGDVRRLGGLPSSAVIALELDAMVSPPTLHVATAGGAAAIRVLP